MISNPKNKDENPMAVVVEHSNVLSDKAKKTPALRLLSHFVSYVLHPVFLPTAMVAMIVFLNLKSFAGVTDEQKWYWIGITAYQTIFFPVITVFIAWRLKFVESIYMRSQKDRIIPLIAIMVYYFWIYQVFSKQLHAPLLLKVLFLGAFWGIILLFLENIFYKISMHTTAAGGMIGLMVILMFAGEINFFIPFLVTLFVAGIIGTARMALSAHSPFEIWMGYLTGLVSMVGAYFFLV